MAISNVRTGQTYATLQAAIDAATAEDVILVGAGAFDLTAGLTIDKNITIRGANAGTAGTGTRGAETILNDPAIGPMFSFVGASAVVIDGMQVKGNSIVNTGIDDQYLTFTNSVFDLTTTAANAFYVGYEGGYSFTFTNNKLTQTGYTEVFDLFEGGSVSITDNAFFGVAGTYVAGKDNNVPLILNLSDATGAVTGNTFTNVDIGILVANGAGPLDIGNNVFTDLHRDDGSTAGGLAAGIVFFTPSPFSGAITIHDNEFSDADAGIRTSAVPGSTVAGSTITIDDNSFTNVDEPAFQPVGGSLTLTGSTIDGQSVALYTVGGSGNDTLVGGPGNDVLDGGAGIDTVDFSAAAAGITVSLDSGSATGQGDDELFSIENVIGSRFNDSISGNSAANRLAGAAGNDTLVGGVGSDTLIGGQGDDVVSGDAGLDEAVLEVATTLAADGAASQGSSTLTLQGALATAAGADKISGVERIRFTNGTDSVADDLVVEIDATGNAIVFDVDDTGSATEKGGTANGSGGQDATGNVLANDINLDQGSGDQKVVVGVAAGANSVAPGGTGIAGLYGTLTLQANGEYRYALNDANTAVDRLAVGETLRDLFTYTVNDGGAPANNRTAQIAITVTGANDAPVVVGASPNFSQSFESGTAGIVVGGVYGAVTQVASGTNGITAPDGASYAVYTETSSGPFTRFDGYRATWPGDYATETKIYLDAAWALGSGFDYSVASNGANGAHLRDFVFHVAKDTSTGQLQIGASNGSPAVTRQDIETLPGFATVATTGWYTFQHTFRDQAGVLAVDLKVFDAAGAQVFSQTLSNSADTIGAAGTVGGNRYGWFTTIDVAGGIAVDGVELSLRGVTELADGTAGEGTATLTQAVTLAFNDVDITDTHTATVAFVSGNGPSGLQLGSIGTPTVVSTASASGGTVGLVFSVADSAVDFLAAGQTVTQLYRVTITDSQNASTTSDVSIVITGTNDAPTLAAVAGIEFTDTSADNTFTAATGTLVGSDVDTGFTLTYGIVDGVLSLENGFQVERASTYGTLFLNTTSGAYRFVPDDTAIEALKTTTSATFALTVSDGIAAPVSRDLTVTLRGANDTPEITVASSDLKLSATEDGSASGKIVATDRDGDALTYSVFEFEAPKKGAAVFTGDTYTYTPTKNYAGTDTFQVLVKDSSSSESSRVTVDVDVAPEAETPTLSFGDGVAPATGEIRANVTLPGLSGDRASVTALSTGGFVTAWQGKADYFVPESIFLQRFDAAGVKVGDQIELEGSTTGDFPSVAALANGAFVVTWMAGDRNSKDVLGQRFAADGTAGATFQVNTFTTNNQSHPSVATLADGSFVVTWMSAFQLLDSNSGVYGQRYDAAGVKIGGEFVVADDIGNRRGESYPSVAALGTGFVVTWTGPDNNGSGITGQRFAVDATNVTKIGGEFAINANPQARSGPSQEYSAVTAVTNGFVVTWMSPQDGGSRGIYGQRFDAAGQAIGGEFQVNNASSGTRFDQREPSVTALGDGFVVTWNSFGQDSQGGGVYGQRFDAAGEKVGGEFQVNATFQADQVADGQGGGTLLAQLANGKLVAIWSGAGNEGFGGVYVRLFDTTTVATGPSGDEDTAIDLGAITAWTPDSDGSESISLVIKGFGAGTTFSKGQLDATDPLAPKWVIAAADVAALALDGSHLTMTPPANANGPVTLSITATAIDTATYAGSTTPVTSTASTTKTLSVTVNAVNDLPSIAVGGDTGSASEAGGYAGISDAGLGRGLEPTAALLTPTVITQLASLETNPAGTKAVIDAIATEVGARPLAFAIVWDYIDDKYSYYLNWANEASARLGIEYAGYLVGGGAPLLGVIAKYAADSDGDDIPNRQQSLHDNLLGNVHGPSLIDKMLGAGQGSNANPIPTVYASIVKLLDDSQLSQLLTRPIFSGSQGAANTSLAFDIAHGLVAGTSGTLVGNDVEGPLTFSVANGGEGTYGRFAFGTAGAWTYTLDQSRPATQALAAGVTVTESFEVTGTDSDGAKVFRTVTVQVIGADDAPAFTNAPVAPQIQEGTGRILFAGGGKDIPGAMLFDLDATDVDSATVSFAFVGPDGTTSQSAAGGRFVIDATTGTVTRAGAGLAFDYEQTPFYDLLIRASGTPGTIFSERLVRVDVIDTASEDTALTGTGPFTVKGGSANDAFSYTMGAATGVFTLEGGEPTSGTDVDTLTVTFTGSADAGFVTLGTGPDAGYALIDVDGNGTTDLRVKDVEDIVFELGAGDDALTLSGNLTLAGVAARTITVNGGDGDDTIDARALGGSRVVANGGNGDDVITSGQMADDVLRGDDGSDTFVITDVAHYGDAEFIDGGPTDNAPTDTDTIRVELAMGALTLSKNDDNIVNIESIALVGASGVDASGQSDGFAITGSAVANAITGSTGADSITGGSGNDVVAGGGGIDTALFSAPPTASQVVWNGTSWTVTTADGTDTISGVEILDNAGGGSKILLVDAIGGYATIAAALAAADAGDTIMVAAGTFDGGFTITESVTLLGANWAIDPNTGTPVAATIIRATVSNTGYATVSESNTLVRVAADNVTIKGFTLDGDNTTLTGGVARNGATFDAAYGIASASDAAVDGLLVENNVVKSLYYGVSLYPTAATPSGNNLITNNRFENFGLDDGDADYGIGVLIYNNAYASVTNNVVTDAYVGIQTGNFHVAAPTGTALPVISGNAITTDGVGIWHNLAYGSSSLFTINDNTVVGMAGDDVYGIWLTSLQNGATVSVTDNDVSGADVGIAVWNTPATAGIRIEGGTLSGNGIGVRVYETSSFGAGGSSTVTLAGTTISNSTIAAVAIDDANGAGTGTQSLVFDATTPPVLTGNVSVEVRVSGDTATFVANSFSGNLRILGDASDNELSGGAGNDTITGGDGIDTISGRAGNDTIVAGDGADAILYTVGDGSDSIEGGASADTLTVTGNGAANALTLTASTIIIANPPSGPSTLTVSGLETVAIDLAGGIDNATVNGLLAGARYEVNAAGGTSETVNFNGLGATSPVTFDLVTGATVIGGTTHTFENFERVLTTEGNDAITADFTGVTGPLGQNNWIRGADGDDQITLTFSGQSLTGSTVSISGDWETDATKADATNPGGNNDGNDTITVIGALGSVTNTHVLLMDGNDLYDASGLTTGSLPVHGGQGNDTIKGSQASDNVANSGGAIVGLMGGSGDDEIAGNGGNDRIDGGLGTDTATYAGARAGYTINGSATSPTFITAFGSVTDTDTATSDEGTDTLTGIETLTFAPAVAGGPALTLDVNDKVQLFDAANQLVGTFDTIQGAVDAASDGQTILVAAGIYNEAVTVDVAVTIAGAGMARADVVVASFTLLDAALDGAADRVTLRDLSVDGSLTNAAAIGIGYSNTTGTDAGTLTLANVAVTKADAAGLATSSATGLTDITLVVTGSSFSGNGTDRQNGSNDVNLFNFAGDASFTDVQVSSPAGAQAQHGIQIAGFTGSSGATGTIPGAIGAVSFTNVTVSGEYEKALVYINGYNDFDGLSFTTTTIGSADTKAGWTGLYIEPVSARGAYTASTSPSAIDLTSMTFAGGAYGFAVPNLILGTPTADSFKGSAAGDTFVSNGGEDTIDGAGGSDTYLVTPSTVTTTITDTGATGDDTATLYGTAGDDTFAITAGTLPGTGTVKVNGATVSLSGLETVVLDAKPLTVPAATDVAGVADLLDLSAATTTVTVALTNGTGNVSGAFGTFTATDFENVTGGTGADSLTGSAEANTIDGGAGDDVIAGGDGVDSLIGGAGADRFTGGAGSDVIRGGTIAGDDANTVIDRASYDAGSTIAWDATKAAWTVTTGTDGSDVDTLYGIEAVTVGSGTDAKTFWLVDTSPDGGFTLINDAITAASAGDTILIAQGTYDEDVQVTKSVTILGAKSGTDGDAVSGRSAAAGIDETTLIGRHDITTSAPVTIDGIRFVNDATTSGGTSSDPILRIGAGGTGSGHVVTNSIFWSVVAGGGVADRAISHAPLASGTITVSDNLFSGTQQSGFGGASWGTGVWSDGSGVTLAVTGNTFQYNRTALNLDTPGTTVTVSNNDFLSSGTAVSVGVTVGGPITWITGNRFNLVDTDFNLRGVTGEVVFDATTSNNVFVDGAATGVNAVKILGGNAADTLTGTAFSDLITGDSSNGSSGALLGVDTTIDDGNSISGLAGNDTLLGSTGNDTLEGGAGADSLVGGGGNDRFLITTTSDYVPGSTLLPRLGDKMFGGDGTEDRIVITGPGLIALGDDVDTTGIEIIDLVGAASVNASTQSEALAINGSADANTVTGGAGNDTVLASGGNDSVFGGRGDDVITGGGGNDTIRGGEGEDRAIYTGAWAEYRVTFDPILGTFTIADTNASRDGTDLVTVTGDNGVETFTFDGVTFTASQLINRAPVIDVAGTQSAATAAGAIIERTPGGTQPVFTFTAVVTDPNNPAPGDVLRYSLDNDAGGRFKIDAATGAVTIANWNLFDFETSASHTISVKVEDAGGLFDIETISIALANVNEAPVAIAAAASVTEDTSITGSVTATDVDSTGLLYALVGSAPTGLTLGTNGTYTFDAASYDSLKAGETLVLRVPFTATDGGSLNSTADLVITVTGTNDAPVATAGTASVSEDGVVTIDVADLISDAETGDLGLAVTASVPAAQGSVSVQGTVLTFTPAPNFNGGASISYTVSDGTTSATNSVAVTVMGVNDAPVVAGAVALPAIAEDVATVTITAAQLLGRSSDVDGQTLSVSGVTASSGALTANMDGTYDFKPALDFNGTVTFSYTVSDGTVSVPATATLAVTAVNDAPTAGAANAASGAEDTVITGSVPLGLDVETAAGALTYELVAPVAGLVFNPNGTFAFTPAANANGSTTFDYVVVDADGSRSLAQAFTITVTPVADAPVALDVAGGTISEDASFSGTLGSTLPIALFATDVDVDSTLTAASFDFTGATIDGSAAASALAAGIAYDPATGVFGFDPRGVAAFQGLDAGESATVVVSFTATDGSLSDTGTVTFTVTGANDAPVAVDDAMLTTAEDTPLVINPALLLANDTDVDGEALTITAVSANAGATAALVAGNIVVTPALNATGPITLTYTLSDGGAVTDTGSVEITVTAVNDAPVVAAALADQVVDEDSGVVTFTVPAGAFTDVETAPLTLTTSGMPAWLTFDAVTRTFSGPTPTDFNGFADITVTATDAGSLAVSDTFRLTVTPVNDGPVAGNAIVLPGMQEDGAPVTITAAQLLANASDIDGDTLSIVNLAVTSGGGTLVSNGGGIWTYGPAANANGTVSFGYQITDGTASVVSTATLAVAAVNDAPVALAAAASVAEDGMITGSVTATDVDSSGLTYALVGSAPTGLTLGTDGAYTFDAASYDSLKAGETLVLRVPFTATDGGPLSSTADLVITVTGTNDAPVAAAAQTVSGLEDRTVTGSVAGTDVEGDALSYALNTTAAASTKGSVQVLSNGTFIYTPSANANGTDSFTVSVSDGTVSVDQVVTVQIAAVNDAPLFALDTLAVSVLESVSDAAVLATVAASDVETTDLIYRITAGDPAGLFEISSAGVITPVQGKTLDFEAGPTRFDLTVTVTDGGTPDLTDTVTVAVSVLNVDDNAPVLTGPTSASVAENNPALIGAYAASDADGTPITFALSGADTGRFVISSTGALTFLGADLELGASVSGDDIYDVVVTATSGTNSASQAVAVTVTDADEFDVTAPADIVAAANTVAENAAAGALVGITVLASDADQTTNGVTYSLDSSAGDRFAISAGGVVSVANGTLLDFEAARSHTIVARATSADGSSSVSSFTVAVADVNDNAPVFTSPRNATVAENAAGAVVYRAVATDADPTFGPVTYSLADEDLATFEIDATSGEVTLTEAVDFEEPSKLAFTVTATQGTGDFASSALMVALSVTDVNEAPTAVTLSDTVPTIDENTSTGARIAVATIAVTDDLLGSETLSLAGADASFFEIDGTTLYLRAGTALNFETKASYAVSVQVDDPTVGVTPDAVASFTLGVTDVNEAPTAIVVSGLASVIENTATRTSIASVTVTDPDGVAPFQVNPVVVNDARFEVVGGELFLKAGQQVDAEAGATIALTLRTGNVSQAVSVSVANVDDNPTLLSGPAAANVIENTQALIGTYAASDADGTAITYGLSGSDAGRFAISNSGALTFLGADLELGTSATGDDDVYDVAVTATSGTVPATQLVTVTVTDANEFAVTAPSDANVAANTVAENAAAGTLVGITVSASDADQTTNAVTYSLDDSAGGRFAISAGGVVSVANGTLLDFEEARSHTIVARATSADGSSSANSFTIAVGNLNDNPPAFTAGATSGTVLENTALALGSYLAADADGDAVSYSLAGADIGAFTLGTDGILRFSGADFEAASASGDDIYDVAVVATANGQTATRAVAVTVTNANDAAPVFSSGTSAGIAENAALATIVYQAAAADADGAGLGAVTYGLGTGGDGAAFAIDAAGAVRLRAGADFETKSSYTFDVVASQGSGPSTVQTVTVSVSNLNDVAPAITSGAAASVAENVAASAVVYQGAATDADGAAFGGTGWALTGTDAGLLTVDGSGAVRLAASANFEAKSSYSFGLVASQGAGPSTTQAVALSVTNVNEAPTNLRIPFPAAVPESQTGAVVGRILVDDVDLGDTVTYTVSDGRFQVATVGGSPVLKLLDTASLSFAAGAFQDVTVTATDAGGLAVSLVVSVQVEADEAGPNAIGQTFAVTENAAAGTLVGTVVATDISGVSGYAFTQGGNGGGAFAIDSAGRVTAVGPVDYEASSAVTLTAVASDSFGNAGAPFSILVNVGDVNEAPVGVADRLAATEDTAVTFTAAQLLGNDRDGDAGQQTLGIASVTSRSGGTAVLNTNGTVTFTPTPNANGAASFDYVLRDAGGLLGAPATVIVDVAAVADLPVGGADTALASVNQRTVISGAALLANDGDGDPELTQALSIAGVSSSFGGTVALNAGSVVFTPFEGLRGNAGFTYSVQDADGFSAAVQVSVQVGAGPGQTETYLNKGVFGGFTYDAFSKAGQVYALYEGLLGRAPDALGFEFWTARFDEGVSPVQLAAGFLASPEGQARAGALDNGAFVTQLYGATLDRAPDAAGLDFWTDALDAGATRAEVATGFALSTEHLGSLKSVFDAGVYVPDEDAAAVARIYYAVLDRAPDAAGLKFWTDALKSGVDLDVETSSFLATAEVQTKTSSLSTAEFVDFIYDNALGRDPDADGLAFWTGAIDSGVATRVDSTTEIAQSQEAQRHLAPLIEFDWNLI